MSHLKFSFLAGSALIAASLPGAAFAYDECVPANPPTTLTDGLGGVSDPTLNGATADSFSCSGDYAGGITYVSNGALTVTKTSTGVTTVAANGIDLTGAGTDSVTWDSSIGGVTGGAGTAGPVIDVTSVSGPIDIITNAVTANQAGTTHGVRATSTGGGNITISRAAGGINNNVVGGEAAIEAVTNGGNISITSNGAFLQGRLRGILAHTSGAGSVAMTVGNQVSASAVDGTAAIDAIAGAGGISITINAGAVQGGAGLAIKGVSAGSALINNIGGTIGGVNFGLPGGGGAVNLSGVAGGATLNFGGLSSTTGRWLASGDSIFGDGDDTVNMIGVGHNHLGGGAAVAASGINFGGGNDTLNVASFLSIGAFSTPRQNSIDFGSGADTFSMSGTLTLNGTTFSNLEAFNNSGLILMGVARTGSQVLEIDWATSDRVADDRLSMPGTTFTGSGSSRIVMDVALSTGVQQGCETLTGIADCLDLRGGATAGVTTLTINNLSPDALQAGYDPLGITLVDVGGGTSARRHFVLDPNIVGFDADPLLGGIIDRPGLFRYALRYDADNQRHLLASLPRWELFEYGVLANAAHSIWHMTTSTVTDRQTDLRDGNGSTVWLRTTGEYSKRDAEMTFTSVGETFALDNSYKLYAGTVMGGRDFIVGGTDAYDYVAGAQLGYVSSSLDFDGSEASGRLTGATGGVYASLWSDWFFFDGAVNLNGLTLDYESPSLGSRTTTFLNSVGAQVDGGVRARLTETAFAEPLVTLAWVRTSFEEISLSGGEIKPTDAESLRGALGLRLGSTLAGDSLGATWFVAGRAWYEFEGENRGVVVNPGADLPFSDAFTEAFGEAELGVNVFNAANTLSGFATTGVKWKEGYSAVNLSLGMRMAW